MVTTIICVVVAVFAIIILYLTRSNIIDLLDRDVVMYDKNYEAKKESLEEAFNCLDLVAQNGSEIKTNPQYIARAKAAYNGLLCTLNSAKLYQAFYLFAIDINAPASSVEDIEKFKIACRAELISKRKSRGEGFKGSTGVANNNFAMPAQPQRPVQPRPSQPRPAQPAQRQQAHPKGPGAPKQDNE